ncbi:hypothetical protein FDK38_002064 [Candidozyma auris]|nr:hypothetical protein FDK38_002064 [[Candida] auris]
MKSIYIVSLLPLAACVPLRGYLDVSPQEKYQVVADNDPSVTAMMTTWESLISNAKTARTLVKSEVKEHFVKKPKAHWAALWQEGSPGGRRVNVAGEVYSDEFNEESSSESESDDDGDDDDADDDDDDDDDDGDEEAENGTHYATERHRESRPAYLKGSGRGLRYRPFTGPRLRPRGYEKRTATKIEF